jgi:hypothetical protein
VAYATGGWSSVMVLGVCFSGAGLLLWVWSEAHRRLRSRRVGADRRAGLLRD